VAEVLLFHHAQGLTSGCLAFAGRLAGAGHVVHTPDLYDGHTFADVTSGVGYAREVGFDTILERGRRAAQDLTPGLVYGGFSLGVLPAQALAQTRPGAKGALLFHGCFPASEFGAPWPAGVGLEVHAMADDEWFAEDAGAARELVAAVPGAQLFLYPGSGHLFTDDSLGDYDEAATALVTERVLGFLERVG